MTLDLDELLVSVDEGMGKFAALPEKAAQAIAAMGIQLSPQPIVDGQPYTPEIPRGPDGLPSLSHLANREISDLNVGFLAFYDYVLMQHRYAKLQLNAMEERYNYVKAQVRLLQSGSPADKSDKTMIDERVREAKLSMMEAKSIFELLDAKVSALDRDLKVISREVTIREQEFLFHGRDNSIKAKKKSDYGAHRFGLVEKETDDEFFGRKKKRNKNRPAKDPKK